MLRGVLGNFFGGIEYVSYFFVLFCQVFVIVILMGKVR